MTGEAAYEAMIGKMAEAIEHADREDADTPLTPDGLYALFARAAAEAIGLKPGCVVVPNMPVLRWRHSRGETLAQSRADFQNSELYQKGDAVLVWVNEGDLLTHSAMWPAASLPRQPEKEGPTAPAPQAPRAR